MIDPNLRVISKVIRASEPIVETPNHVRRSRTWLELATRNLGSFLSRHLVNGIALIAAVVVIFHDSATLPDPALERYAGTVSDLSLALLAAWIFNLLIVEIPRRRDRTAIYTGISWRVGLMALSGIRMIEFLATAAGENIGIHPNISGRPIPANRAVVDRICAKLTPSSPCLPNIDSGSCWDLIRGHVAEARDYQQRLQPWLLYFDSDVIAAMNRVTFSQLTELADRYEHLGNDTLENLAEQIFEHWKASDQLMATHYAKVLPLVKG